MPDPRQPSFSGPSKQTERLLQLHRDAMNNVQTIGERDRITRAISQIERDTDFGYLHGPRVDAEQAHLDGDLVDMGDPHGETALVERLATDLAMIFS